MSDTRTLGGKYRLLPSQLNALIDRIAEEERAHGSQVTAKTMVIGSASSSSQIINYYVIEKTIEKNEEKQNKKIAIFHVGKDSSTRDNEPVLPYIPDIIQLFYNENKEENITLLFPLRQCRGFFRLPLLHQFMQKRHIVLS